MRVSVERLRVGLLVAAGLLVLATAGFLEYGRFRAKHFLTELPKKLGADIRQETNAFTYSQTVKGRTVFTVHAAKAVQHSDGKYTLHDVGIVLYGQGSEQPNRVDRIYGSEFEYDQNAGVIRAMGEVHLDLQAPAGADAKAKMEYAEGKDLKSGREMGREPGGSGEKDDRLIHVKTRGLVFLRQLGVAATDQDIEFEYRGLTGHARGADYNSDTGVLVLQAAVKVNGLEQGKPIVLTAAHAELDRLNRKAILTQAKYVSVGQPTRETAEAQHAVVHTRPDGSVERLEAQGDVTVTNGSEGRVVADRADVALNQQNKPESVRMFGGVRYAEDATDRQIRGEAQEAQGSFDGKGGLEHVVLREAVTLHEKQNIAAQAGKTARPLWSERELNAGMVEFALLSDQSGKTRLREAKASVDARLNVIDPPKPDVKHGRGATSSTLSGDVLTAHFTGTQGRQYLSEVHGSGHTALKQSNEAGMEETTSGDSLVVKFRQEPQRRAAAGPGRSRNLDSPSEGERIATAVQEGNVVMTRRIAKPGAAPDVQHAVAQRAEYDGDTERMMLTGGVELSDTGGTMWAERATMERVSGDARVEGGVKASYRQSPQSEIVHVLAERAELKKASDEALFYGTTGKPARLWQGGSQVQAPVLDFTQKQRRLVARGSGQATPQAVHTVLVSNTSNSPGKASAPGGKLRAPGVVRIASREMVYSDEAREADFTGGVLVESTDGKVRGQQAVAYLQSSNEGKKETKKDTPESFMGGNVERVVVTGQIRLEQPGRNATGEQLIYTAADGLFVLTGTPGTQPKVFDETRGMVTGTELRFHTGDESIVISNGASGESGLRVHTETRVKR